MQPSFVTPPLAGRPLRALLGDALRRPGGRKAVSVLSLVLFLAGTVMFAYPVGTDVYSRFHQGQLTEDFASAEIAQAYRERRIEVGQGLTTLRIPKLGRRRAGGRGDDAVGPARRRRPLRRDPAARRARQRRDRRSPHHLRPAAEPHGRAAPR
jgi:hypothetical protein